MPRYETYDVLDDNQLTASLSLEATHLQIRQLDPKNRLFASIKSFLASVDVVENELLNPSDMPNPFGSVLNAYLETLDHYRFLTYGQQAVRAVRELEHPELANRLKYPWRASGWDFKTYIPDVLSYRSISENLTAYINGYKHRAELRLRQAPRFAGRIWT